MSQESYLNIVKEQTEIQPGMMFWQVLQVLAEIDGGRELSQIEGDCLRSQIVSNVDWAYEQRRKTEMDAEYHEEQADKHTEAASSLRNRLRSFDKWIVRNMQASGTEELSGDEFVVKLKKSAKFKPLRPCAETDYDTHPEFVRVKVYDPEYQWEANTIKQAIKEGVKSIDFATIDETFEPKFEIKKRGKK